MFAKNTSNGSVFTTSYTYGSNDKEYVFCCKGRPFVALASSSLYTPASTLVDYNLVRQLGLKMTDIQCRKFSYGGHKLRILGRISTAVQCVQNGRIGGNFHIKGLVVSDLNTLLDTHCVAGSKMQEKLAHLSAQTTTDVDDEEEEDEEENYSSEDLDTSQEVSVSSAPISPRKMSAPSTTSAVKSLPSTTASVKLSSNAMMSISSAFPTPEMKPSLVKSKLPFTPFDTTMPSGISGPHPARLYTILDGDRSGPCGGYDYWSEWAEGKPLKLSRVDGEPRVVNLTGGTHHYGDMLRVGDWRHLADPTEHQARHIILANLRRAAPDRVCLLCSYNMASKHECRLPSRDKRILKTHCKDCCQEICGPSHESI